MRTIQGPPIQLMVCCEHYLVIVHAPEMLCPLPEDRGTDDVGIAIPISHCKRRTRCK